MRYIELLETINDVLYHSTSVPAAIKIISDNSFKLSKLTKDEMFAKIKNFPFYMSTSRTKSGSYINTLNEGVTFNLNKQKLKQKFQIYPVNYFRDRDVASESEDRIYSSVSSFNAIPYIMEIHAFSKSTKSLSLLKGLCETNNIQIWFYDSKKDWKFQLKTKAVTIQNNKDFNIPSPKAESPISKYMNLLKNPDISLLLDISQRPEWHQNFIVKTIDHNSSPKFEWYDDCIKFENLLRSYKLKDVKSFLDFVVLKYKDIIKPKDQYINKQSKITSFSELKTYLDSIDPSKSEKWFGSITKYYKTGKSEVSYLNSEGIDTFNDVNEFLGI